MAPPVRGSTSPVVVPRQPAPPPPKPPAAKPTVKSPDAFEAAPVDPQTKLDEVEKSLSPTFTVQVDGKPVTADVPAPFRMNGGDGQPTPEKAMQLMTDAIKNGGAWPKNPAEQKALQQAILRNAYGRPTPEGLKLVTDKLIQAGALKPYLDQVKSENGGVVGPKELTTAIRRMQWDHGVGADCNGVCQIAYTELNGKAPTQKWGDALIATNSKGESLNPNFKRVSVSDAKPGDVIKLDDLHGDVGHNVTVTDSMTISADDAKLLSAFPKATGPLKAVTVYSSWGAGGDKDDPSGGVRKETWVFDEGRKKWGTIEGTHVKWSASDGPYEHKFVGVYRAK